MFRNNSPLLSSHLPLVPILLVPDPPGICVCVCVEIYRWWLSGGQMADRAPRKSWNGCIRSTPRRSSRYRSDRRRSDGCREKVICRRIVGRWNFLARFRCLRWRLILKFRDLQGSIRLMFLNFYLMRDSADKYSKMYCRTLRMRLVQHIFCNVKLQICKMLSIPALFILFFLFPALFIKPISLVIFATGVSLYRSL